MPETEINLSPTQVEEIILKNADKKLDEIADFIFSKSQENLLQNDSINEGLLFRSANINRRFLEKEIVYPAPYAGFVEFGTDPHMPPVEPLERWAALKLGMESKEARKTAWAIARTIEKEGTDPKPFLRPAIEAAKQEFKGVF